MLTRPNEYKKMAAVEAELWWYQALHNSILKTIKTRFYSENIRILDAGCGTGGLLSVLQQSGYQNLEGFDLSPEAVRYCTQKGLKVSQNNLTEAKDLFPPRSFDVIVSCDVLYFLSEKESIETLKNFKKLLKPGGILIFNLPALKMFKGMHDISVGITERYTLKSFLHLVNQTPLHIHKYHFWPFLLSPIIGAVRAKQRWEIAKNPTMTIESDVELPSPIINTILKKIAVFDTQIIKSKHLGSSLFIVLS